MNVWILFLPRSAPKKMFLRLESTEGFPLTSGNLTIHPTAEASTNLGHTTVLNPNDHGPSNRGKSAKTSWAPRYFAPGNPNQKKKQPRHAQVWHTGIPSHCLYKSYGTANIPSFWALEIPSWNPWIYYIWISSKPISWTIRITVSAPEGLPDQLPNDLCKGGLLSIQIHQQKLDPPQPSKKQW